MKILFSQIHFSIAKINPRDLHLYINTAPLFLVSVKNEVSVIAPTDLIKNYQTAEHGWRMITLDGPIPFDQVGVLVAVLQPLKEEKISILANSSFDTDFIFIKEDKIEKAKKKLLDNGFIVHSDID